MNDNGWIKIRKSIYNHWLWQDAEYLKWWIDLLLMANWEDDKKLVGKQLIEVRRGQLIASVSFLVKRWKRNHKMIERFLSLLSEEDMISKCVKSNISIITITNYDKYQSNESKELENANGVNQGVNLRTIVTSGKSERNNTSKTKQGVNPGVSHGVSQGVNPGVTIKEYKEDKESKEKDIVVADAHTHTHARMDALDLRPYQARLEAMAMSCRLKPQELDSLIKEFNLHLESVGETYDDANKYLQHLYNWINKLKEKRNANNHSTLNNQPDFAQRISGAATVALGFLRDGNAGSPQTKSSGSGVPAKVLPF